MSFENKKIDKGLLLGLLFVQLIGVFGLIAFIVFIKIASNSVETKKISTLECFYCKKRCKENQVYATEIDTLVCDNCIFNKEFDKCADCGIVWCEEDKQMAYTDKMYCSDCLLKNEKHASCNDCEMVILLDYMEYEDLVDGTVICQSCYIDGEYYTCDLCGELENVEYMTYNERKHEYYCGNCN